MNWKALRASAWLAVLFLVVYGGTNYLSSYRSDVGSFYFGWERALPFVPWLIVPYMSIDMLFLAAPFFCVDDQERRTLVLRVVAAFVIGGTCFLLFPLRFSFDRPEVAGWLGWIAGVLHRFDRPFNQLPALHITFCMILGEFYARRCRGVWRWAVVAWFLLIVVSTPLSYQHHMIDLAGGLAVGLACLHLIPAETLRAATTGNRRVGMYYLGGAGAMIAGTFAVRPWSWLLLWPAFSLGAVAGGYFGLGAGIYRKARGRLPVGTWVLLWPVLLGQRVSLGYDRRRSAAWDAVTERVWIGRRLEEREAREAVAAGVCAVVDLAGEFSEAEALRGVTYLQIPVLELTAPTGGQLAEAVAFITAQAERGVVYVHGKIGNSCAAAVAGAYLLASGKAKSAEEAVGMLRAARKGMVIRPEAEKAIRAYAEGRKDFNTEGTEGTEKRGGRES